MEINPFEKKGNYCRSPPWSILPSSLGIQKQLDFFVQFNMRVNQSSNFAKELRILNTGKYAAMKSGENVLTSKKYNSIKLMKTKITTNRCKDSSVFVRFDSVLKCKQITATTIMMTAIRMMDHISEVLNFHFST